MGFWDPRSDDDQLQVTCVQFQEEQLVVGLQGGMVLLFQINKQSANVTIQVGKSGREGGREGGRGGREGGREEGREGEREGGKEGREERGKEGGRDGRKREEGGREERGRGEGG